MSNNRDNSPELDYFELRRRHEQYKNRARRPMPAEVPAAEAAEPAEEMRKPQPVKKAEVTHTVEEPKKALRMPIPEEEPYVDADAFDEDVLDEDFDEIEDIDEEEAPSADDMYENPNPFDSFIRFFHGVKDNISAKRDGRKAEDDLANFDGEDFEMEEGAENAPRATRVPQPDMESDIDDEGDDSAAEDIADIHENAPRASRRAAQDADDFDADEADDLDEDLEDDVPRGGGFKKFISLFVTRIDEDEEEEDEDEVELADFEDDSYEDFAAEAPAYAAPRHQVYSDAEGGLEMDEMNRPNSASPMAEGLETSGMSRRERRELAMRLAAEEAARKAQQEDAEAAAATEEAPAVESVYEAAAEEAAPVVEEKPAETVEEPTREFKPVNMRDVRKAEPEEELFDFDDDDDEDEDEEEVKKPRRGLFSRRKKVVEEEDDEDLDDEDEDEDEEDEEDEVKKPRRGLFGRRKKAVEEEDDEDDEDLDDEEDEDDEDFDDDFDDFDEYDEYDDDDEDDEDDEDEYDDDDDERRSFGHHLLGVLKAVLGIVLLLLVVVIVLNFLYIGGNGAIVETLHDKMGNSTAFHVLFPSYEVRETLPEEVIEPEATPEPTAEPIEVPEVEANTVIPNLDANAAQDSAVVTEPVVDAAPVVIEEAPAAVG